MEVVLVLLLVAMDGMRLMTGPEQAKVVEEQAKKEAAAVAVGGASAKKSGRKTKKNKPPLVFAPIFLLPALLDGVTVMRRAVGALERSVASRKADP